MNDWKRMVETWNATLQAVDRLGGHRILKAAARAGITHSKTWGLNILAPARGPAIARVEARLGWSARRADAAFSCNAPRVSTFNGNCPKIFVCHHCFARSFRDSRCHSKQLSTTKLARRDWVEQCFPDPGAAYDAVWHDKLAVIAVGNGDYIGIDLADARHGEVVYLSHDYGEGHGYVLGADFTDFLRRWTPLGCPGPEDWQWLPFTSGKTSMLKSDGGLADE
jgi:hypothetical protein